VRDVYRAGHNRLSFTLIELLVVVAIIALLISILLPSLSKARAQARSSVCASRITQLVKSMLLYANDYDEEPPFGAHGVSPTEPREEDGLDGLVPGRTDLTLREEVNRENWLTRNISYICGKAEEDWPDAINGAGDTWMEGYVPTTGSMFPYTRFADLYRCPDFERIPHKSQSVFNFTRSCLGRRWILPFEPMEPWEYGGFAGGFGNIVKLSQVYSPSSLQMAADESWQFHVAEPQYYQGRMGGGWECSDPIYYYGQSEIGQYHGQPVVGFTSPPFPDEPAQPDAVKRGNVAYYDGHVALVRDFMPGRNLLGAMMDGTATLDDIFAFVFGEIFYQRGYDPDPNDFADIFP